MALRSALPAPRHRFRLPRLFPYQHQFLSLLHNLVVVVSATQVGKTFACACWLLVQGWLKPGSLCWWAAPVYRQARTGYRAIKRIGLASGIIASCRDSDFTIVLVNGTIIECRSWERPQNLQGDPIHAAVVDEAGLLTSEAHAIISSRRAATLGPIRYIGNPSAVGAEFWLLYQMAVDRKAAGDPEVELLKWTWRDRHVALLEPWRSRYAAFVAQQERELPPHEFARLYLAEFAVPKGSVFGPYVDQMFRCEPSNEPHPGHTYVVSWDIGITEDFTVGLPLCLQDWTVSWMERLRPGTSSGLEFFIRDVSHHWNHGTAVVETNGIGKGVVDDLSPIYDNTQPWCTDNPRKNNAVYELIRMAKAEALTMARYPVMMEEFRVYQGEQNPKTQLWSFGAPKGVHDDTVASMLIGIGASHWGGAAHLMAIQDEVDAIRKAKEKPRE